MHQVLRIAVLGVRITLAVLVVAALAIGAAVVVFFIHVEQEKPAAREAASRADDEIHSAIAPGMSTSQVAEYFNRIGAKYYGPDPLGGGYLPPHLQGAASFMSAVVDQTAISPGPLIFLCNKEIRVQVYFDESDNVREVGVSRICL
jgi:hypothetical protein